MKNSLPHVRDFSCCITCIRMSRFFSKAEKRFISIWKHTVQFIIYILDFTVKKGSKKVRVGKVWLCSLARPNKGYNAYGSKAVAATFQAIRFLFGNLQCVSKCQSRFCNFFKSCVCRLIFGAIKNIGSVFHWTKHQVRRQTFRRLLKIIT